MMCTTLTRSCSVGPLGLGLLTLALLGCMKPNPLVTQSDEGADEADDEADDDDSPTESGDPLADLPENDENEQNCALFADLDSDCANCLAGSCCALMTECSDADGCECLAVCLLSGGKGGSCKDSCSAKPDEVPELEGLFECAEDSCDGPC